MRTLELAYPGKGSTQNRPVSGKGMWHPISTAPFDRDLELAVLDSDGVHALVFPCRRVLTGWIKSKDYAKICVSPTHWREWIDGSKENGSDIGKDI